MENERCPKCEGLVAVFRDTSTGIEKVRKICFKCGWEETKKQGPALWRIWQSVRKGR